MKYDHNVIKDLLHYISTMFYKIHPDRSLMNILMNVKTAENT